MDFTISHPLLGEVTGLKKASVTQFLGIQYASLANRLAAPKLRDDDYGGRLNATKFGPTVISPPVGCDLEFGLIQCPLEKPEFPGMSDVDGLNLNITVPADATKPAGGFPVVVFIHGGGMMLGGNWWPQADFASLVELSSKVDKPIIGVGINYRLGVPGFLDSEQLRAGGYPPNRGLLDQKTAFQWLKKNIAGFGGNPNEITAIGQSAGSLSVMILLDSSEELFQRAVCLSGNSLALPIFPPQVAQSSYVQVLDALGLEGKSVDEQIAGLLTMSPEDVLTKVAPTVPLGPVIDDGAVLVKGPPSFADLASPTATARSWCSSLMIGSASLDAGVFEFMGLFSERSSIGSSFIDTVMRVIPEDKHAPLKELLQCYGISQDMPDEQARTAILQVFNDVKYFASAAAYATSWSGNAHLYYLTEPNPWDGPYKNGATHVQDVAFLFQNYKQSMSDKQRGIGEAFAVDVCTFAYGEQPYLSFKESEQLRLYGPGGDTTGVSIVKVDETGPSKEVRALWDRIGLDELSNALTIYHIRA